MRRIAMIAAALAMSLLAGIAQTSAQSIDRYTEFMQKSGLWNQLATIEPAVQQDIAKAQFRFGALDSKKISMFRKAASEAYAVDRLRDVIHMRLAATLTSDDLTLALAWLDSPLGARITRLEEAAAASNAAATLREEAVAQAFASLAADRRALVARLSAATDTPAATANMIVNTMLGIAHGVAACTANDAPATELDRRAPLMRAQLKGALEPTILALFAPTYVSLSDSELEQYVVYLESDPARTLTTQVLGVFDASMFEAAKDLGRRIGEEQANEAAKASST